MSWYQRSVRDATVSQTGKPGDLPLEQPMRFDLVLNNKTAKAIGMKVSPELLVRVDRVIE
jgi:putative ABC transport system substrate-binding protein